MGLFTGLLTLPLAPVRGAVWVADQVAQEADRQLYDEDRIRSEMLQLELDAEDGVIDDEERERKERELLDRLAEARLRRASEEEFGGQMVPMGTSEVEPEGLGEENRNG